MNDKIDLWTQEGFEDSVARALLTCFESKIKKSKGAGPNTLNSERMQVIRNAGIYIPGNDRLVIAPESGVEGSWEFDTGNDPLPLSGCIGMPINRISSKNEYGGFFQTIYFQRRQELAKNWYRQSGGQIYEMLHAFSENEYITGERSFFTVNSSGKVSACRLMVPDRNNSMFGQKTEMLFEPSKTLKQQEAFASVALQFHADSRYCWQIEAREHKQYARLGCIDEQVKSLLYARSLPMTDTGRKRPILHLVEAHKRRLRNGTDIDISKSLRGIDVIEMGGTQFVVNPPKVVAPELSKPSRKRFFPTE
jgi:hypothetical protein